MAAVDVQVCSADFGAVEAYYCNQEIDESGNGSL